MREQLLRRIEDAECLAHQFGLHRFNDNDEDWWPTAMKQHMELNRARANAVKQRNGGSHAQEVRSDP